MLMRRIFVDMDYEGHDSDLSASHELEKLLEYTGFKLRRFNIVDHDDLFNVTIGNG